MSLNLIIGRSGSGKSKLMYQNILQDEKNGNKVLVFVPDFARVVAEQEYFKYTKQRGMINTKITTLKRFAEQNINKNDLYGSKEFLPEMSKLFIIKKCINDHEEVFNIFKKAKGTQGFVDKMYKMLNVFESEGINDEKSIENITKGNDFLALKFKEIYDIYNIVKNETKDKFISSHEQLDFCINSILNNNISKINSNTKIYFDGYNNFNKKEMNFIQALLKVGVDVCISIDLDMEVVDRAEIFAIPYETYRKLKKLASLVGVKVYETLLQKEEKLDTMLHLLQAKIFTLGEEKSKLIDDTVKIRLLKNPYEEIEYIACDILKKVRENGFEYKDFKIYYNNESMYDLNIKRIFNEYNIPVYLNGASCVSNNTLVVFLLSMLKQVKTGFTNINVENILEILKTGLTCFSDYEVALFENYVNEFGIKLYKFKDRFEKNNDSKNTGSVEYDLEKINEIREYMYELVVALKEKLQDKKTTVEITQVIYDFLTENGVISKYENQLKNIQKYSVDEYNRKKQVVSNIYEVMDNICLAFKTLEFDEYVELFEYGISNIEIGSIPPYIDQVEICNIDSTRSLPRKFVYVIGVFENGLPIISNNEGIFTDKEILKLEEQGIEIAKTSENRNNMALFNVYKAINSCEEQICFTVPSAKITGENLRYSPVILKIKDILNISIDVDCDYEEHIYSIKKIFEQFVEQLKDLDTTVEEEQLIKIYTNYMYLMEHQNFKSVIEYERGQENLSEKTVQKVYPANILSSVSRLERFNSCPFNYFATYVLKLKERKEYKLSNLDLGSIMHKVLEDYSKFLIANNIGFEDVLDDEKLLEKTRKQISQSIEEIFDTMYVRYSSNARYVYLKQKLNKGMFNVIKGISKSFKQSEFRPLGFEIEFDNGKLYAPIEVKLDNGTTMFLRGKIDRVDVAKVKDNVYLRVVDYKSSSKDLKLSDVKEGVSLQLMTYMAALIDNKEKIDKDKNVIPAALSYFTLNTDVLTIPESLSEDKISEKVISNLKMKGIYLNDVEILKKLDNKFTESKESYIDITTRRLNNSEKSLAEKEFLNECNNMQDILKEIATKMVKGKVTVSNKEKSCDYCNYSEFCRKRLKN